MAIKESLAFIYMIILCSTTQNFLLSQINQKTYIEDMCPRHNKNLKFNEVSKNKTNLSELSTIFKFWNFKNQEVYKPQTVKLVEGKIDTRHGMCDFNRKLFKSQVKQFTNQHQFGNALIPGNFIHIFNQFNVDKGFTSINIDPNFRNKMKIVVFNGINGTLQYSNPVQYQAGLNKIIGQNIQKLNSKSIKIFINPQSELEKVLRYLNLPTRVYQQISIASQQYTIKQYMGRISIILFQQLFSTALQYQQNLNLLEFFFKNDFKKDYVFSLNQWGNGRIPQFIEQVNYGRLLVVSCEDIEENRKKMDKLLKCFSGGKVENEQQFNTILSQLTNNLNSKYYAKGAIQFNAKSLISSKNIGLIQNKIFNWKNLFFDLRSAEENYLQFIQPVSANIRNILGDQISNVQNRFFTQIQCNNTLDIIFKIKNIEQSVDISIRKIAQKEFGSSIATYDKESTIILTQLVDKQPFQMKLTLLGKKVNGSISLQKQEAKYLIKMQYEIEVNGKSIFKRIFQNNRMIDGRQKMQILVFVDPKNRRAASNF